jgi:hypothetical protein
MEHVFLNTNVTKLYYFPSYDYLHLILKDNVVYSLKNVQEDFLAINNLKKDKKIYVLLDMANTSYEHIPKDVMEYMANSPYSKNHIKIALVTEGIGQKLVGNFYLNIFKPKTNSKIFNTVSDAFKWFGFTEQTSKLKELDLALQHNR